MANVMRAVRKNKISATFTLATADDLDGTQDGTQDLTVPKGARVLIIQHNNGTAGTAGIDVIEVSIAGNTFYLDDTLLAVADPDVGGTLLTALNAAGVEPVNMAAFKSGPYSQDVKLRCGRKTGTNGGTTWVTGAPSVTAYVIK